MYHFLYEESDADLLDDVDLEQFEKDYHLQLPSLLKDYLKKYNGMPIRPCSLRAGSKLMPVEWIFPLYTGSMPADRILDLFRPGCRIPPSYYPLASSSDDYHFFLDTETGHVMLMPLENPNEKILAAVDLEAFFARLDYHCLIESRKSEDQTG